MALFSRLFGKKPDASKDAGGPTPPGGSGEPPEELWQRVYDARAALVEQHFGALAGDILKLNDLLGLWVGGGLYVVPAERLGPGLVAYMTFGLSNPDMPTQRTIEDFRTEEEIRPDGSRVISTKGVLKGRQTPRPPTGRPGYGYELIIVARENAEWPLWLLQWAVKAEMLKDADLIGRVEKYHGLTVEEIGIGRDRPVHIFIAKAQQPLLEAFDLPTGRAEILVITVVTEDEMRWSLQHGREALLAALMASPVGQHSVLDRESVVSLTGPKGDWSAVTLMEAALALAEQGQLFKILLFPEAFGGEDLPPNRAYVPRGIPEIQQQLINSLIRSAQDGLIDQLNVAPEYKGDSFVPARLHIKASHSEKEGGFEQVIEIW